MPNISRVSFQVRSHINKLHKACLPDSLDKLLLFISCELEPQMNLKGIHFGKRESLTLHKQRRVQTQYNDSVQPSINWSKNRYNVSVNVQVRTGCTSAITESPLNEFVPGKMIEKCL